MTAVFMAFFFLVTLYAPKFEVKFASRRELVAAVARIAYTLPSVALVPWFKRRRNCRA